jgi:hypothetical protein
MESQFKSDAELRSEKEKAAQERQKHNKKVSSEYGLRKSSIQSDKKLVIDTKTGKSKAEGESEKEDAEVISIFRKKDI